MATCAACGQEFSRILVEGTRVRKLARRKRCFNCAPLGSKRAVRDDSEDGVAITCDSCGRRYRYDKKKGHTENRCNSCCVNLRRKEKKRALVAYMGGKCIVCGYDRLDASLDFHHIVGDKDFSISGKHCLSLSKLKREVDKCVLLCKNCHAEVHASIINLALYEQPHIQSALKGIPKAHSRRYRGGGKFTPARPTRKVTCAVCGTIVDINDSKSRSGAKYCSQVCAHSAQKRFEIAAKDLQVMVWKMPTTEIATVYGVSDTAVAKRCKKLGVKKPPRGYWSGMTSKKVGSTPTRVI